jgi:hypothetical protein
MKTLYSSLFAATLLITNLASARPVNKVTVNGNWSVPATWSLGRIPQDGDSVVIPSSYTLTLDKPVTLNNLFLTVAGTFALNKSALTLDAASVVKILSGAWLYGATFSSQEVISINGVVKFTGNTDFLVIGPTTANKNTASSPNGFSNNPVILPLTFLSFTVKSQNDNTVLISWNTADEVNNSHFEIERSYDQTDWQVVATVLPGNNSQMNSYQSTDQMTINGTIYYRIRQVDLDGKYMYSAIALVKSSGVKTTGAISSNGKNINIRLNSEMSSRITVRLISMNGQVLRQQTYDAPSTLISFTADSFNTGAYVVQVADGNGLIQAKVVVL